MAGAWGGSAGAGQGRGAAEGPGGLRDVPSHSTALPREPKIFHQGSRSQAVQELHTKKWLRCSSLSHGTNEDIYSSGLVVT